MDISGGGDWFTHDVSQEKKNLSFQNLGDKLPIPVTLSALEDNLNETDEDCYRLGEFHFRTVHTVGVIMEMTREDGNIKYLMHDPENTDQTFVVLQFGTIGEGGSKYVEPNLSEDQRVRIMGKLKNFAGEKTIMAYYIQKLTDDKDYEIFKLESHVAKLFFKKNLIEKMRSGETNGWQGMLAPPTARTQNEAMQNVHYSMIQKSPSPKKREIQPIVTTNRSPEVSKSLKSRIRACIRAEENLSDYGTERGVPLDKILRKVKDIPLPRLRVILNEMEESGMIYSANTDEWMTIH
uniref:RPA_C domain-containing protein n=1 Tax=Caenorhabditis japonica TaxID=281687 RepID=A0A8R1HR99_CAEJA